ncbi:MAG: MotE family protein, partial [Nitratireductor sp.]
FAICVGATFMGSSIVGAQSLNAQLGNLNLRIDTSIRADNLLNMNALSERPMMSTGAGGVGDGVDRTVVGSVEKAKETPAIAEHVSNMTTGAIATEEQLNNYCYNVSDSAVEARSAILQQRLMEIEKQVEVKLVELEEKTKELQEWMAKRESFSNKVNDSVVQIFQAMRPDAAASQFAELGPVVSAAIVAKLSPKTSSLILTEMDASEAAEISMVLTSALKEGE